MPARSPLALAATAALLAPTAAAQLTPTLLRQFVDVGAGGNGNIGVTQDEVTFDYYVIDFSNTQTVHTFDLIGTPLTTFASTGCTPAQPSPNDITYDPFTQTLWLVDNNGGTVVNMTRQGICLGGFVIPITAPNYVGITVDRSTGSLFVSQTGSVVEVSRTGTVLGGGFSFVPPSGSTILAGITYVPATDRFLIVQSSGTSLYEVDRTGLLISTTPLSTFGVVNTQGLHYNPALQELAVVDNSLSTTFVFSLPFCSGTVAQRGEGCADGGGTMMVMGTNGCPNLGTTIDLRAFASPGVLPMLIAGGVSDAFAGAVPLPLALSLLGGPAGCLVYTSTDVILSAPMTGSTATLPFTIPANPAISGARVFFQALKLDPLLAAPLQLASSNYLDMTVL
jgi:hypothetical protein